MALVATKLWNAHAEKKKAETGDSYMTSLDRAGLVPAAARILREQGLADMATKLENTTTGARKVNDYYNIISYISISIATVSSSVRLVVRLVLLIVWAEPEV